MSSGRVATTPSDYCTPFARHHQHQSYSSSFLECVRACVCVVCMSVCVCPSVQGHTCLQVHTHTSEHVPGGLRMLLDAFFDCFLLHLLKQGPC